jgi:hypothetical protein
MFENISYQGSNYLQNSHHNKIANSQIYSILLLHDLTKHFLLLGKNVLTNLYIQTCSDLFQLRRNRELLHFRVLANICCHPPIIPLILKHIRGALGNNCAGQPNLKTVYFKETIVSGYFLGWSSAICVFFAALYPSKDGRGELFSSDVGGDPLQALLEGVLGQQAACQL